MNGVRSLWGAVHFVGAGLSREGGPAVHGTGFAGVRGASPFPQRACKINES